MTPRPVPYLVDCALARLDCGERLQEACTWVWYHHSTPAEREAVDGWLVQTAHPMAYEAGLPFHRFCQLVQESRHEEPI